MVARLLRVCDLVNPYFALSGFLFEDYMSNSTAMIPFAERKALAEIAAKSAIWKDTMSGCFMRIQAGAEMGIPPFAALSGILITNGRPTMSANLMATLVKQSDRYDYIFVEFNEKACELAFLDKTRKGAEIGRSRFTMEDAKKACLLSGKNAHSWTHYPRNMLFSRAISNGYKWFCPDLTCGSAWYVPEELGAVDLPEKAPVASVDTETVDVSCDVTDAPGAITSDQVQELEDLARSRGSQIDALKEYYKVTRLDQLSPEDFKDALIKLNAKERASNVKDQ